MKTPNRTYLVDRRIGAISRYDACISQRIENITTFACTLRSQAILYPWAVGARENSLYRRNNAEINRSGYIVWIYYLGMLNSPSQIGFARISCKLIFVNVEQFAIGTIADSLNGKLVIVFHRQLC